MKSTTLLAAALVSSLCSAPALAGASEDAIAQAIADYRVGDARGQWNNPFMPAATGNDTDMRVSADQQLMQIVASYTRERLDRYGWMNTYLTNSNYSSGNPLLAVQIGDGITLASTPGQPAAAPHTLAQLKR